MITLSGELTGKGDRNVLYPDLCGRYTSVYTCTNASSYALQICAFYTLLYLCSISIKIMENQLEENSCEYLPDYEKDKNFLSIKVIEEIKGKD